MENRTVLSTLVVTSPADSGPGSLRTMIGAAKSGDTIDFASSIHRITLTSNELDIASNLTIDGPGAGALVISGDGANRVFEISNNAAVTIKNLTVADGKVVNENGGGILVDSGASLTLSLATVTGNTAVANSQGYYGSGGGIENDGSLSISGSNFTDNVCSGGSFLDPVTSGSAGGAIDSQGTTLTVSGSMFTGNEAVGPSTGTGEGNGGAINNSSAGTISNSVFIDNQALGRSTNGGAISAGENDLTAAPAFAINNCVFTANAAVGANGANDFTERFGGQALGGAIASAAPLTIDGGSFTGNVAQGGSEGNNLNPIDGGPFVDSADGGAVIEFYGTMKISGATFTGNKAIGGSSVAGTGGSAVGGAVASFYYSSTTLTGVTFIGNSVIGGAGGPGFTGGSASGGGLDNGVDSTAMVSDCNFVANVATGGSGGSSAIGSTGQGGAIANGGGFNQLQTIYAGLPSDASTVEVVDSQLALNVAKGGAGGSGANGGSGQGGGTYVYDGTSATIDDSWISLNAAYGGAAGTGASVGQGVGGGLFIGSGAVVTMSSPSEVVFNYASSSDDDVFGTFTVS